MSVRVLQGDCRDVLATMPADSVHCVVTSPPYYGLRDYGTAQWDGGDPACDHVQTAWAAERFTDGTGVALGGCASWKGGTRNRQKLYDRECGKCGARRIDRQIGLEQSPDAYLATMVEVMREVRRVLRDDGTLWLNVGDSYGQNQGSGFDTNQDGGERKKLAASPKVNTGVKPKDLLMMPARLALALQADGWWVRSKIVWAKPNPMPESVTDRPTSSYEEVFLLTKSSRYFYDADAVREPHAEASLNRYQYAPSSYCETIHNLKGRRAANGVDHNPAGRNLRNVWTIATAPYAEAHFATFPPELAERCIKAGTRRGDTVLDPFGGAGTTGLVADRLGRDAVLIELSESYCEMARKRIASDAPLFTAWPPAETDAQDERMADLFQEAAD
jgi:DNA modification methylase